MGFYTLDLMSGDSICLDVVFLFLRYSDTKIIFGNGFPLEG